MANNEENKSSVGTGFSADELLRSLNVQYKSSKIISDIAGDNKDIDKDALQNAADCAFAKAQIDMNSLSDAEFKYLFDSYLGASKASLNLKEADYSTLHKHIIEVQKKTGIPTRSYREMKADVYRGCIASLEEEIPGYEKISQPVNAEAANIVAPTVTVNENKPSEEKAEIKEIRRPEKVENIENIEKAERAEKAEKKEKKSKINIFAWLRSLAGDDTSDDICVPDEENEIDEEYTVFDTIIDSEPLMEEASQDTAEGSVVEINDVPEKEEPKAPIIEAKEETRDMVVERKIENIVIDDKLTTAEMSVDKLFTKDEDDIVEESDNMMTDTAMMKAFGIDPRNGNENEIPKNIFDETSVAIDNTMETENIAVPEIEEEEEPINKNDYHSFEQNKSIFAAYRQKYNSVRIRAVACAVVALVLFVIENMGIFGLGLPSFMSSAAGYATVEWALLFVCAILVCENLISAAKNLCKFEFTPDSVTLIAFILTVLTSAAALFSESDDIKMFNFPFAVCVLFSLIGSIISIRKEILTFRTISTLKNKRAVTVMPNGKYSPEMKEFADDITEGEKVYCTVNTEFVDGYLSRKRESPKSYGKLKLLILAVLAFSVVCGILSAVVAEAGVYGSFANTYVTFLISAPLAVFLSCQLPMYGSAIRAYSNGSAIIGDAAPEMIDDMAVLAFTDNDAFKNGDVRIKSVKVVGNNKIENIIYYASAVCSLSGGPLSKVLSQATLDYVKPKKAEICALSDIGVEADIDGRHIVLGVPQYMGENNVRSLYQKNDDRWSGDTNKRILYLACDGVIMAKFYIEYNVSPDFLYIIKSLSQEGIAVSVRSNDPCIDSGIFYKASSDDEKCSVKVIKGMKDISKKERVKARSTIVVSSGTVKGLVRSLLICKKINKANKINFIIRSVAAVIGVMIMCALIFTGLYTELWSVYPAIYQAFWLIPYYIIFKIFI